MGQQYAEAAFTGKSGAEFEGYKCLLGQAVFDGEAEFYFTVIFYADETEMGGFGGFAAEAYKTADVDAQYNSEGFLTAAGLAWFSSEAPFCADAEFSAMAGKINLSMTAFSSQAGFLVAARALFGVNTLFSGQGSFSSAADVFVIDVMVFTGLNFRPGDTLEIDLCNYYIALNGVNVIDRMSGAFFGLYPGENRLNWRDNVASRAVDMSVLFQNKYL